MLFKNLLNQLMGLFRGPNIIWVKGHEKSYDRDLKFPKEFAKSIAALRKRQLDYSTCPQKKDKS